MSYTKKLKRVLPIECNYVIRNGLRFFAQSLRQNSYENERPKNIYHYVDAADYENSGDLAISLAIQLFLEEHFGKEHVRVYEAAHFPSTLRELKKTLLATDVICLTGGGNMGSIYQKYEAIRRLTIASFPESRIVVFPQTIEYEGDRFGQRELYRSIKTYSHATNLHLFAREQRSYELMSEYYETNDVRFVSDMAFYLKGRIQIPSARLPGVVGVCLRDDCESFLSEAEKKHIVDAIIAAGFAVEYVSTMTGFSGSRLDSVQSIVARFSQFQAIVTDRLHGMIFSYLSDTPCYAFNNTNGKVELVYASVAKPKLIRFCHNVEQFTDRFTPADVRDAIEGDGKNAQIDYSELFDVLQPSFPEAVF